MHLKLIACEVLTREVGFCLRDTPHRVDVEFTKKGEHANTQTLRALLQGRIDAVEAGSVRYDAVLLGFGLCGNATVGLTARSLPVVLPRAHDCCTLFLGSRGRFKEHFGDNPSRPFHSAGYSEKEGEDRNPMTAPGGLPEGYSWEVLVDKYGEEDALEILETLTGTTHGQDEPFEYYIDIPETRDPEIIDNCRSSMEGRNRQLTVIQGDLRLVRMLVHGQWDPKEFLVLEPQRSSHGVYDWEEIVRQR